MRKYGMLRIATLGTVCLLAVSALRAEGPIQMGVDSLPASAAAAVEAAAAFKPDPAAVKTPAEAKPAEKAAAKPADPHAALVQHPTIQKLVQLTNAHRAQYGLAPVRINPHMCAHAQQHATWMASTGAFAHSNLPYMEIIFAGPGSAEAAIQGWIYSPAHHGIMLSGSEVGFGYQNFNGTPYWVGVFR